MNRICEYYVDLLFKSNLCFKSRVIIAVSSIVCPFKRLHLASNGVFDDSILKNYLHSDFDIKRHKNICILSVYLHLLPVFFCNHYAHAAASDVTATSTLNWSIDSDKMTFSLNEAIWWIEDSYFSWKQRFEVKNVFTNTQFFTTRNVIWWTAVVLITSWLLWWFYQLFELILTAPIHCRGSAGEQII